MNDKDREVLLKIHKHVKKAVSYCENIDTQEASERLFQAFLCSSKHFH